MKFHTALLPCLLFVAAASGCASAPAPSTAPRAHTQEDGDTLQPTRYRVVFKGAWTESTHPLDYPEGGLLTGPHFSGLIGATHGDGYSVFAEGKLPTAGLERLSEEGKHSPLDSEIEAAIARRLAGALFESDPLKDPSSSVETEFEISMTHPLVSAVAMIAPSPDWFAGAAEVRLLEDGAWVSRKTVTLWAYDSGGDRGTTYKADDQDTDPKRPTKINGARHFMSNGQRVPVGTLTFTRLIERS